MVIVVRLAVLTVEVAALLLEGRKVGRFVEWFVTDSGEGRPEATEPNDGKLHTAGLEITDLDMNPDSNGDGLR